MLVVAVVVIILVTAVLVALAYGHGKPSFAQSRDASQIRGAYLGMALWAESNQDRFPRPSRIDTSNSTVPELAEAKDTTANIMSLLVFNSFFPPEILISPAEANGNIRRMEGYELDRPSTAVDPAHALWDPALRADFTGDQVGNVSYAHLRPVGPNIDSNQFFHYGANPSPTRAVIGNRGPEVTAISRDHRGNITPTYKLGADSLTFQIHGSRVKWEGNIGYNDNHVNFETSIAPEALTYTLPGGQPQRDTLFYDEPEVQGNNNFLGIFITGGPEASDFKSIWD